jgi:hypothetical protein
MRRPDLVADCERCAALCCTATSFDKSEDFAIDKAAGVTCPHVTDDHRCAIHADRVKRGFSGCLIYDCYGAGPRVTQAYARAPHRSRERDDVFRILRDVHELLWQLTEAVKLCPTSEANLAADLAREIEALDAVARDPGRATVAIDLHPRQLSGRALLRRVGTALGGRRERVRLPVA